MMKRFVVMLYLLTMIAVSAAAAAEAPTNRGPERMDFKMGVVVVPFNHWKHQKSAKDDCFQCHSKKVGKIEGWGKETAHKVCIPCHDLEDKGPVECHQCHK